jgi:hypothetical protein
MELADPVVKCMDYRFRGNGGDDLAGTARWQTGVLGEDFLAPGATLVGTC